MNMKLRRRGMCSIVAPTPPPPSDNYFETCTFANGYLNTNGSIGSSNYIAYTVDYIPVSAGDVFQFTGFNTRSGATRLRVNSYDSNQANKTQFVSESTAAGVESTYSFTIPDDGTAYIRFSWNNASNRSSASMVKQAA